MTAQEIEKLYSLLKLAPVELENTADAMTGADRRAAVELLEQVAQAAASRAAYFEERQGYGNGDQGHTKGVKAFNSVLRKVRKAFGYDITHDIRF
jgi:hypothetical protein